MFIRLMPSWSSGGSLSRQLASQFTNHLKHEVRFYPLNSDCNASRFPTGTMGVSLVAVTPDWESRHLGGNPGNINSKPYRPLSRAFANGG